MNIYKNDLLDFLQELSKYLPQKIELVAVGGTALTLLDIKDSTIDIDFDIPVKQHFDTIIQTFQKLGFKQISSISWDTTPAYPYRFDLFKEGYIFCTQLIEDSRVNAKIIMKNKRLKVYCLNPYDLITTKLLRSSTRDVDDSIITFNKLQLNILKLTKRYLDTAIHSLTRSNDVVYNFKMFLNYIKNIDKEDKRTCQNLLEKWRAENK